MRSNSRRDFARQAAALALSVGALPELLAAANAGLPGQRPLKDGAVILFQGDSITDAGRRRENYYANDALGMGAGYAHHAVVTLLGRHPGRRFRCYNRGVSGNKVFQLAERWHDDCLQLRPDVISILIGVNDFWHTLSHAYQGTAEIYERDFRRLLDRTREALPETRLLIGEPFVAAGGSAIDQRWGADFAAYQAAAQRVAADYEAVFIPYQTVFDEALKTAPAAYWCPDGVHPSLAGAYLMAQAWMAGFDRINTP
jgi:lysophospholipase L1-like esterase